MSSSPVGKPAGPSEPSARSSRPTQPAGPATPARPTWHTRGPLAPFASVDFRNLWVGSVLAWSCQFLQLVAFGWVVYELTDSPIWLGIVSFARGIPMLLLSLPGGVLVDRVDRRKLLIVTQVVGAAIPALLALMLWTGTAQPVYIAIAAFMTGALNVLVIPARQALIPGSVPRGQAASAIALTTAGTNAGRVLGPSFGGLVMAALGLGATFALQALMMIGALLPTLWLPPDRGERRTSTASPLESLLDGLRYVWQDRTVFSLMVLAGVTCLLVLPYTNFLPIFARDILQAGPAGMGLLVGATGVGSVIGSLGIALLPPRRLGVMLILSVLVFSLLLIAMAVSTNLWLSVVLMALMGLAQSVFLATNNTLIIVATPDELRGRVMSVYITTWGFIPLGALPQGVLADWFGAPAVVAGAAVVCVVVVALIGLREPRLREI
jgi:MFS family permease